MRGKVSMKALIVKLTKQLGRLTKKFQAGLAYRIYPNLRRAFDISSHLTIQERVVLYRLSKGADCVAEVGSYIGASACCFGAALLSHGKGKIICIDTWNNDSMSEGTRDTYCEFLRNTEDYRELVIPVRGFSTEVVDSVRALSEHFHVLFIDGDHSYNSVKADWDTYKSFLKQGSTVVFHDYGWADGVRRVVHEDVMPQVGQFNKLPNMWWGTIGKER